MFQWDEANLGHLAGHGVKPDEVEEALLGPRRLGVPAYRVGDELRWAVLGASGAGRLLFVVFTRRDGRVRVVTARDAAAAEKGRYRRR